MTTALNTISSLQLAYAGMQGLVDVSSIVLRQRSGGKVGMTPENSLINLGLMATLVALLGQIESSPVAVQAYGILCVILFLQAGYSIKKHLSEYFKYKALLRRAKIKYEQTGEKTDLSMGEYSSLNTLMVSVVVRVYGLFAAGAGVYFAFVGFPQSTSEEIDLNWK